jgi:type VI secretion system protein ImpH
MASSSGRTDSTLTETLFEESFRFEFFEAVRVLERLYPQRQPVGYAAPPRQEVARFRSRISLSFPPSAIYEMTRPEETGKPSEMTVAFMGLAGLVGVLPRHYTEMLLERIRQKDFTFSDFLDLFNHRFISLFYRAWEKYRFPVAYERSVLNGQRYDPVSLNVFNFFGMGTAGLRERLDVEGETLLFYSGLLAQQPHSAVMIESLLADYFGIPVRAVQFTGQWLSLTHEQRTRIISKKQNQSLGRDAILGSRFWDQQAKFRLRLGPMKFSRFKGFFPVAKAFKELVQLVRLSIGQQLDFDLQLVLEAAEVPSCRIALGQDAPRLGWSSWLKTKEFVRDTTDAIIGSHWTRVRD